MHGSENASLALAYAGEQTLEPNKRAFGEAVEPRGAQGDALSIFPLLEPRIKAGDDDGRPTELIACNVHKISVNERPGMRHVFGHPPVAIHVRRARCPFDRHQLYQHHAGITARAFWELAKAKWQAERRRCFDRSPKLYCEVTNTRFGQHDRHAIAVIGRGSNASSHATSFGATAGPGQSADPRGGSLDLPIAVSAGPAGPPLPHFFPSFRDFGRENPDAARNHRR